MRTAELGRLEDATQGARRLAGVRRMVDEQPVDPVTNLVLNSADRARHDGTSLPHRLGHCEAEPLLQTLLDDDGGVPLERVHERGVLFLVVHRQHREVHRAAGRGRQREPGALQLAETLGALRVVGHAFTLGPASTSSAPRGASVRGSRRIPASRRRVLHRVPPRDLHDERRTHEGGRPSRTTSASRASRLELPSSRTKAGAAGPGGPSTRPAVDEDGARRSAVEPLVLRRERVDVRGQR